MAWYPDSPPEYFTESKTPSGEPVYLHKKSRIYGNITIGRFSYIFENATIVGHHPIRIGSFTSVGSNFWCTSLEDHHTEYVSTYAFQRILGIELSYPADKAPRRPYVEIGSDVWIGNDVRVMAGTEVGHGCVLGAKALVTKDCEPYGIYGGVPAKLIRFRFPGQIREQLLEIQWWHWPLERIKANAHFFSLNLQEFTGDLLNELI